MSKSNTHTHTSLDPLVEVHVVCSQEGKAGGLAHEPLVHLVVSGGGKHVEIVRRYGVAR